MNEQDKPSSINCCEAFKHLSSDLEKGLSKIDQALLKRGWRSAILSIKNAPTFEEAFENVVAAVERIFPDNESKLRARK